MNWSDVFLFSFVLGFALSLFSWLGGTFHIHPFHLHSHGHGDAAYVPAALSFLTWFGGAGYALTHYSSSSAALAVGGAVIAGSVGSWVVLRILGKVLEDEQPLSADDYRMIGILGRVSSPIREGGTGEMIFSLQGTRRGIPIRSDTEKAIDRDTEVVITRFERGIAYVKQWDELSR